MLKRKALIISNPGEDGAENYCKGVLVDVQNYRRHLLSPLGGAWQASEITLLNRPDCFTVTAEVLSLQMVDYSFVVFVGHGYYSSYKRTTMLELRKGYELDSMDLRKYSSRRTLILDCCRKIYPETIVRSFSDGLLLEKRAFDESASRILFDEGIARCSTGIVVGYGCKINQVAGDSESKGGYYSASLFRTVDDWKQSISKVPYRTDDGICSIVKAHNGACPFVEQLSGGTQTPDIEKPRTEPYFPFAVLPR